MYCFLQRKSCKTSSCRAFLRNVLRKLRRRPTLKQKLLYTNLLCFASDRLMFQRENLSRAKRNEPGTIPSPFANHLILNLSDFSVHVTHSRENYFYFLGSHHFCILFSFSVRMCLMRQPLQEKPIVALPHRQESHRNDCTPFLFSFAPYGFDYFVTNAGTPSTIVQ